MKKATFKIWRGTSHTDGDFVDYTTEFSEGMVVLDAVLQIQARTGKRSCLPLELQGGKMRFVFGGNQRDAEIDVYDADEHAAAWTSRSRSNRCGHFRLKRDLVTDVSWNYEVKKKIKKFKPRTPDAPDGTWRMQQTDVDRIQEFRKCIECYLCQDVCHVLRDHHKHEEFIGPRFLVYAAALEMHPLDTEDRLEDLRNDSNIGYCNITKCCTKVCPENITITDNAIIPLKERVVDEFYDPIAKILKLFKRKNRFKFQVEL